MSTIVDQLLMLYNHFEFGFVREMARRLLQMSTTSINVRTYGLVNRSSYPCKRQLNFDGLSDEAAKIETPCHSKYGMTMPFSKAEGAKNRQARLCNPLPDMVTSP